MKIMIIDDEPDIREYLMAVLEDSGYETCSMEENTQVGEAVGSCMPDLIILDIMMPSRSGMSIYRELRSTPEFEDIPVTIISGMLPETDFKMAFKELVGGEDVPFPEGFMEKPIQLKELMAIVERLLALKGKI